ncbi:MAG: DNA recombination protein RmuC [Elusimicrobiota bacterium]|jgi:DNA recombination protein RmuC|nr:DNA recombination protein RmuC [Elusimicrobiota bacterium]
MNIALTAVVCFLAGVFIGRRFFADTKDLEIKTGILEAEKKKLEAMHAEQKAYFDAIQSKAGDMFNSLASNLLDKKTQNLTLENQKILNPLAQNIEQFKAEIKKLSEQTTDKTARLETQLTSMQTLNQNLAKEAGALTQALQNKKAQGNFGEMILEDVLQAGGLKEGLHYLKQPAFTNDAQAARLPDFIINLPDERRVIIDSKMSLTDYTKWVNETDEAQKPRHLKNHIAAVKANIAKLSGKEYQKMLKDNSLDFALMFIPIEYAYMAALEGEKDLASFAASARVGIVTASSLMPVISIIEGLWRLERTNKSMQEIIKVGEDMHKKVAAFLSDMESLGKSLSAGHNHYNNAMTKLAGRGSILSKARDLEELGIKTAKKLPSAQDLPALNAPQGPQPHDEP